MGKNSMTTNFMDNSKMSTKILVVEDALPERVRLAMILQKLGYQVEEAEDGARAFEKLQKDKFSIVISDWRMPKMSGFDLCKKVKSELSSSPYFILLTGRDNRMDMVSAMDAGADDYLCKPFNSEELRVRVQAGTRLKQMQSQLEDQNAKLEEAYATEALLNMEIQQDLKAAEKLQRSMLPEANRAVNFVQSAYYFKAAQGVAGDSFSVIPLGQNHVAFYQIDVVGHGVKAAMLSFAISRFLHEQAKAPSTHSKAVQMQSPAKVLKALNTEFLCDDDCQDYFTMVYGVLDVETGRGALAQAGHPNPLIVSSDGKIQKLGEGGIPIGLFASSEYQSVPFQLKASERLMVASDGIFECHIADGRQIDDAILHQVLRNLSDVPADDLQSNLEQLFERLVGEEAPADDISMLFLEIDYLSQRDQALGLSPPFDSELELRELLR